MTLKDIKSVEVSVYSKRGGGMIAFVSGEELREAKNPGTVLAAAMRDAIDQLNHYDGLHKRAACITP